MAPVSLGPVPRGHGQLSPYTESRKKDPRGKDEALSNFWPNQGTPKRESLEYKALGLHPKLQQKCDWGWCGGGGRQVP